MKFDFDTIVDRSFTDSTKFDRYRDTSVLPLWVADMDFRSAPAIVDALKARVEHGVYGYTETPQLLVEEIITRLDHLYNWQVAEEDLVFLPGVVPGLNLACRAFSAPNEAVVTSVPIYGPFMEAPIFSGNELKKVPAIKDGDRYGLDMDGLRAAARGNSKLLLLCNPYNPLGRVLDRGELSDVVSLCLEEDLVICSDEIHCDLLFDGRKHIPTASLGREASDVTVTLMAPSKTFNLAGFGGSFAIIQNPVLRDRFKLAKRGIMPNVNIMAYVSMLAAYRDGDEWYREMIAYLQANRDYLERAFQDISGISMNDVEATYLAWLDVSSLRLADAPAFFESHGLGMSEGARFGETSFMRLNFGCSRRILEEAMTRFDKAISSLS